MDVRSKEYVIDVLWDCILDQACWRHVDGEYLFQISHSARIGWIPRDTIVPAQPGPPGSPLVSVSVRQEDMASFGRKHGDHWRPIFYFTAESSHGLVDKPLNKGLKPSHHSPNHGPPSSVVGSDDL